MDEKARFEALHALSEQAWRDWDHKTRHEWRLSFALWAALLAAGAAVLPTSLRLTLPYVVVGGSTVLALHLMFLAWIQRRLGECRKEYVGLRSRMPAAVKPEDPTHRERAWCESPSVWVQAGITLLLVVVLGFVATSEAG